MPNLTQEQKTQLINLIKNYLDTQTMLREKQDPEYFKPHANELYAIMQDIEAEREQDVDQIRKRISNINLSSYAGALDDRFKALLWHVHVLFPSVVTSNTHRFKNLEKKPLESYLPRSDLSPEQKALFLHEHRQEKNLILHLKSNPSYLYNIASSSYKATAILLQGRIGFLLTDKQVVDLLNLYSNEISKLSEDVRKNKLNELLKPTGRSLEKLYQNFKDIFDGNPILKACVIPEVKPMPEVKPYYMPTQNPEVLQRQEKAAQRSLNQAAKKFAEDRVDIYAKLGIEKNATESDIKQAYKQKALEYRERPELTEINEIRAILLNPEARKIYDQNYVEVSMPQHGFRPR